MDVLREVSPGVPTLGVCLGLEAAVYEYGGTIGRAPEPIHGKASAVDHDGDGVFEGLAQGFRAGRYHSLIATEVPDCFEVSATAEHGDHTLVMGVRHRKHPLECVQFHPESVLTAVGHDIIEISSSRSERRPTAGRQGYSGNEQRSTPAVQNGRNDRSVNPAA